MDPSSSRFPENGGGRVAPGEADGRKIDDGRKTDDPGGRAALEDLVRDLREAHREFVVLLSARIDLYRAKLRRMIVLAAAALLAAVLGLASLVVALVLLLDGLALGLGEALGGREWLGRLLVGAITLGSAAVIGLLAYRRLTRARARTLEKYREQ